MAFHTGKPAYRSNPSSAEVRESLAYLKTYTDLLSGAGVSQDDLTYGFVPVGSVLAYVPGYFTSGANAGFTVQMASANTAAGVNALLNSKGFYVSNGAALNDALSGIFNGSGRYLPNLTDDRFLMGDTAAGGIGGGGGYCLSPCRFPPERRFVEEYDGEGLYHQSGLRPADCRKQLFRFE